MLAVELSVAPCHGHAPLEALEVAALVKDRGEEGQWDEG